MRVFLASVTPDKFCGVACSSCRFALVSFFEIRRTRSLAVPYVRHMASRFSHVIVDSGAYSFLFSDLKVEKTEILRYFDDYMSFVDECKSMTNVTFVELDVQTIFGCEFANSLREHMRTTFPKIQMMNVHHPIDGVSGLHKFLDTSNYLAITAFDSRAQMSNKQATQMCIEKVKYIRRARTEIKIHALGISSEHFLRETQEIQMLSCDSTNYFAAMRSPEVTRLFTSRVMLSNLDKSLYPKKLLTNIREQYELAFQRAPTNTQLIQNIRMFFLSTRFIKKINQYKIRGVMI